MSASRPAFGGPRDAAGAPLRLQPPSRSVPQEMDIAAPRANANIELPGLLAWLLVGVAAGWLASTIMGSKRGLLGSALLGLVGAVVGGVVFSLFGLGGTTNILGSILIATVGAVIVLAVVGR